LQLDEKVRKLLEKLEQEGIPPTSSLPVAEARRLSSEVAKKLAGPAVSVAEVRNLVVPTPEARIQVRKYSPRNGRDLPALVYFHGGGWVIGDLDSVDWLCRSLAIAADCVVFSADYRLAPEHKFPIAVEDSYWVTRWIAENGIAQNIDPRRMAVGGDSAGGNLATAVCLMAHDRGGPPIVYQLLIYPITNHAFETDSYRKYADGYYLTAKDMRWFWNHYLRDQRDGENPYASPLLAKDLSSQPPALVITAEFDPLRDEGEAYAKRLQEASVPAKISRYDAVVHGFLDFADLKQTRAAIDEAAAELGKVFARKG
jgi:acetyl esterase